MQLFAFLTSTLSKDYFLHRVLIFLLFLIVLFAHFVILMTKFYLFLFKLLKNLLYSNFFYVF